MTEVPNPSSSDQTIQTKIGSPSADVPNLTSPNPAPTPVWPAINSSSVKSPPSANAVQQPKQSKQNSKQTQKSQPLNPHSPKKYQQKQANQKSSDLDTKPISEQDAKSTVPTSITVEHSVTTGPSYADIIRSSGAPVALPVTPPVPSSSIITTTASE